VHALAALDHVPHCHIYPFLERLQGGDPATSLSSRFQEDFPTCAIASSRASGLQENMVGEGAVMEVKMFFLPDLVVR